MSFLQHLQKTKRLVILIVEVGITDFITFLDNTQH
jgi:hypothetical protein